MQSSGVRDYPLAPAVRARLAGVLAAAVGAVVLVVTVVSIAVGGAGQVLAGLAVLVVIGLVVAGVLLGARWYVVRLDDTGYRVRFVRGAGRAQGRWTDVEDLTTTVSGGTRCVVLRLRDGQSTTIPVGLVAGDREEFVDELQRRLDAGHGYRRL